MNQSVSQKVILSISESIINNKETDIFISEWFTE